MARPSARSSSSVRPTTPTPRSSGTRTARRSRRAPKTRNIYSGTWQSNVVLAQGGVKWKDAEAKIRSTDADWDKLTQKHNFAQVDEPPLEEVEYDI